MEELEIQSSQSFAGTQIMRLRGPLTLRTLFEFHEATRNGSGSMIIDLTEVPSMDSAGLGSLLGAYASCRKAGRGFAVAGAGERLQTLFDITHVRDVLPIFSSVEAAEQGLTKPPQ